MSNLLISDEESSNSPSNESAQVSKQGSDPVVSMKELPDALQEREPTVHATRKVSIRFQPIGATPLLRPQLFEVSRLQTIGSILKFLMRRLRLKTVHVYVLSSFQPTPDETIGSLYDSFKTNNELILSYCEQIAYG